jgi:Mg/Co/Ni transporter MgtE
MNLYLDIDGVLLTVKNPVVAEGSEPFIQFITTHFNCFWLTTHCKGDSATAIAYLSSYLHPEIIEDLKKIQPTNWSTLKTEGIDLQSDFYWIDDFPMNAERKILQEYGKEDRVIVSELSSPNELDRIQQLLFLKSVKD